MVTKVKKGDIILFKNEHPSFKWNNGLYIVLIVTKDEYVLSQIDKEGKPSLFDDGRFMSSVTGTKNPYVFKTNLTYKLPKSIKHG